MALPDYAIEIQDLTKRYQAKNGQEHRPALDHVSLKIPRGSIFGLLGPNGAGKSTLINILAGLVVKSSGIVQIWRIDIDRAPRNARAAIGIVPQELNIDPFFTPEKALDLQAGLYGVPKAQRQTDAILKIIGLEAQRSTHARGLSGGMRRRLLIGKAMVHDPPILVLDEPTAGVDIELRRQLWDNVRSLNQRGVTILLTTHYLEEAQELCDHIAIIDRGQVVANEQKHTLLQRLDYKTIWVALTEPIDSIPPQLKDSAQSNNFDCKLLHDGPYRVEIRYRARQTNAGFLLDQCRQAGLIITDVQTQESDLEDIFLQLTSHHEVGHKG